MAIFGNIDLGVTDLLTTDTAVIDIASIPDTQRYAITGLSIHNTGLASISVEIFDSPDLTSAAGKRIAKYDVAADSSESVVELIGQGGKQNIIAVASALGLNTKTSITKYNAND